MPVAAPMRTWARGLLLCSFLLAPLGAAAAGEGSFTVRGPITFPETATLEGKPLAFYVGNAPTLGFFQVDVPHATIFEYRKVLVGADSGILPAAPFVEKDLQERSWAVTNARVAVKSGWDQHSFLGLYAQPDAILKVDGGPPSEPRLYSHIGRGDATPGDAPFRIGYSQEVTGPHIFIKGEGQVEYVGGGGLKIRGPTVEIQSTENLTTHRTGTSDSTGERTITWVFVRLDTPGILRLNETPFQAATGKAEALWDGMIRFTPTRGDLRTNQGTYSAEDKPTEIDGRFSATLVPLASGTARMDLSGDLRSSSLTFAPIPRGLGGEGDSWIALLVVGAVVVGAGGGAIAMWRAMHRRGSAATAVRPVALPFTAEDCKAAGAAAACEERWADAAEWFERGVRLAPTSARLHADLAFALSQIGDLDRALLHFGRSHELSNDGESAFNAACAAVAAGRLDDAETWLVSALERSPEFVLHLREDPEWAPLLGRPTVLQAERGARERMRLRGWRFSDDVDPSGAAEP